MPTEISAIIISGRGENIHASPIGRKNAKDDIIPSSICEVSSEELNELCISGIYAIKKRTRKATEEITETRFLCLKREAIRAII